MKQSWNSYEAGFKFRVVEFAEINGNARENSVNEKLVRDWGKYKKELTEILKTKCAKQGDVASSADLENELYKWVLERR